MNDFWQENKRLLTLAGCGLLVYLIGWLVIDNLYGSKVASETRNVSSYRTKLNSERYSVENRNEARSENEALRASLAALRERAEFVPRPEFVLPPGSAGVASSHYFAMVEQVRERLAAAAGRKRIVLPQGLDLDMLQTNSVDLIGRHLAALDLLDRALTLAIEHNVKQIKKIHINLDPAFSARRGLGPVEETTIELEAVSAPDTITDWLQATQTTAFGQVLPVRSVEARTARAKQDELRLKVTFSVVTLHLSEDLVAEGEID
ncbi:MAG: hypothetical protein R3F49_16980 [Planctomycetota bacterium]